MDFKWSFLKSISYTAMPCDVAVLTLDVYNNCLCITVYGQTSHLLSLDVNSKLGPVILTSLFIKVLAVCRRALEKLVE